MTTPRAECIISLAASRPQAAASILMSKTPLCDVQQHRSSVISYHKGAGLYKTAP